MNTISKKKSVVIFAGCLCIGIVCEILSILMYYGLWGNLAPRCRSACEIWPGIPTSDICILICLPSNRYYGVISILGLPFIATPLVIAGYLRLKLRRK